MLFRHEISSSTRDAIFFFSQRRIITSIAIRSYSIVSTMVIIRSFNDLIKQMTGFNFFQSAPVWTCRPRDSLPRFSTSRGLRSWDGEGGRGVIGEGVRPLKRCVCVFVCRCVCFSMRMFIGGWGEDKHPE